MASRVKAAVLISVVVSIVVPTATSAAGQGDHNIRRQGPPSMVRWSRGDVGAGRQVLIYGPSLAQRRRPNEATVAERLGFDVTIVTRPEWSAMVQGDFAAFDAIVFGDPNCKGGPKRLTSAVNTQDVWAPIVLGNVAVSGFDAVWHAARTKPGPRKQIRNMLRFVGLGDATGLSVSLSCYYAGRRPGTPVDLLDGFGTFTVNGQGRRPMPSCPNHIRIVDPSSPLVAGTTSRELSGWDCSVHQAFDAYPKDFTSVAIERKSELSVLIARAAP